MLGSFNFHFHPACPKDKCLSSQAPNTSLLSWGLLQIKSQSELTVLWCAGTGWGGQVFPFKAWLVQANWICNHRWESQGQTPLHSAAAEWIVEHLGASWSVLVTAAAEQSVQMSRFQRPGTQEALPRFGRRKQNDWFKLNFKLTTGTS